jgi:hypothetical protein
VTVAHVRHGDRTWAVSCGTTLTFGRGTGCDIQLRNDPHLSRRAGALVGCDGYVLIRNESQSKPVVVRPPVGEDKVLEPRSATTSLPLLRFDVILYGDGGAPEILTVNVGGSAPVESSPPLGSATVTAPIKFTPTQRRMLLALCEPLLTQRGPAARAATYAEIAGRLGLKQGYVRNVIKGIREELTGHGVFGLSQADGQDIPSDDFRQALARWALRSGWVNREQLAESPDQGEDPTQ